MDTIIPQKRCYKCTKTKPLDAFTNNRSRSDGKAAECQSCKSEMDVGRHKRRTDMTSAAMRASGLSRKAYNEIYERQGGKCAICDNPETSRNQHGLKKLAVDHNHTTGKFRALLCQNCNIRLAVLEDAAFVNAAQEYLKKHVT